MGYYTKYNFEILDKTTLRPVDVFYLSDTFEQEISKQSGYSNPFGDECKWGSHEHDTLIVSQMEPLKEYVIKLRGSGEEEGDLWHKYFHNGKMQECRALLTYPPFDETKLQ